MFHGSIVAMVTPMHEDGSVDEAGLKRLVEFHIDQGSDGIVAVGTTGESATLDEEEHIEVIARVVEAVDGRVPVIGGTGANATTEALRLTQAAAKAGVDGCLLVTPYYNRPTQHGLLRHFQTVAEAVDIPILLYNVPGRTACDLLPVTVAELAGVTNIVGIKEASGIHRIRELKAHCDEDFCILCGEDDLACEAILLGGQGVISVTANVAPALMHEMCIRALAGDGAGARQVDGKLQDLHAALFLESNPIPVKWALSDIGLIEPGIRLPLTPLSEPYHEAVRAARQAAALEPA